MRSIPRTARHIGVLLRCPSDEYLTDALQALEPKLPHVDEMPCGNRFEFKSLTDIPLVDTPCPCGDPNHFKVWIEIDPRLDRREAVA